MYVLLRGTFSCVARTVSGVSSRKLRCPKVSVVVPAQNEARNIGHVLRAMPSVVDEIILVDGNSVDDTIAVALQIRPDTLIVRQGRRGKGNALAAGFEVAAGEYIVMLDADGSMDPQEIYAFVAALDAGADYAKGSRFTAGGGSDDITPLRRAGNWMLNAMTNVLFRTSYSDLCYGYNAFTRDCIGIFALEDGQETGRRRWGDGFEIETILNTRVAKSTIAVTEVPSFERLRLHGTSHLHTFRDGSRVMAAILRERFGRERYVGRTTGAPRPATTAPRPATVDAKPAPAPAAASGIATAIAAPEMSVVICAYTEQRWDDVQRACDSVRTQLGPGDELIVVIDHNDGLLALAQRSLTGIRVVPSTGGRGLSGARNTGVQASRGDVVAFLDDDAMARSEWLGHLRDAFRDTEVAAVGTAVEPQWSGGQQPRWFPAEFGWVVGCSYQGLPTAKTAIRNPIGASMAVRRSAFGVVGGFSELVGRVGSLPVGCEETEFCIRLAKAIPDAKILHEPASSVDHVVPPQRQTVSYFLRRCFHEGRSKWAVTKLGGARAGLSAERRYVRAVLPAGMLRGVSRGVLRADIFAIGKAVAIMAGLAATVVGFLLEASRRPWGKT